MTGSGSPPSRGIDPIPTATSRAAQNVFFANFEPAPRTPEADCISIDDLVSQYEGDTARRKHIERARQRIAVDFYTDAGNPIARLRLEKGWSQARLAEAIGSTQSHIARIESGKTGLMLSTIVNIAKALAVNPEELAAALARHAK